MKILFGADIVGRSGNYHPVYQQLLRYPPRGWQVTTFVKPYPLYQRLRDKVLPGSRLKVIRPPVGDYDLVYAGGNPVVSEIPWVCAHEHMSTMTTNPRHHSVVARMLDSEKCKKILPWSHASADELKRKLKDFGDKLQVVYPALKTTAAKKTKHDGVNLLFVGKFFHGKGGKELVAAFERLAQRYDVEMTMITDVGLEYAKRHPTIRFLSNVPDEVRDDAYSKADVFVMPTTVDTFGLVFLEAMSVGLPIVSTTCFAVPEIVQDGRTGLLVECDDYFTLGEPKDYMARLPSLYQKKLEDGLIEKLTVLIESAALRRRMGRAGRKEIEKGKFSIETRNSMLEELL